MSQNSEPDPVVPGGKLWAPNFPFAPSRFPIFYGWVIVFVATIGVVFSIPGQTMGFGVFTDTLMDQLGLTRSQLSGAYFAGTVMSGFTLPLLGRVFDRVGARKMIVYAALTTGGILVYLSQTKRLLDLTMTVLPGGYRVGVALLLITAGIYLVRASAQGVLTMASRNAIGKWFDYHRGTALALSGVVTSGAFSIAPRLLEALVLRLGWDGAWLLLGAVTIGGMATVGWLLVRDNPEECGMIMDGSDSSGRNSERHADAITYRDYTREEALRTRQFWIFNLSFCFPALFGTAYTFHIASIGAEVGRTRPEVFGLFVPMAFASIATNLLCGWISSRLRLKYLLVFMNLAGVVGALGLIFFGGEAGKWAYVVGNGIVGGCFSAISGIVWPRFFGRKWLGAISGFSMSSMVIASSIGPFLFARALAMTGSYNAILWPCLAVPALLAILSFVADNPQRRWAPELE